MENTLRGVRRARAAAYQLAVDRLASLAARPRERGDVPGWVLVTLMTAGLVSALWIVAQDQLVALFDRAMNTVTGP